MLVRKTKIGLNTNHVVLNRVNYIRHTALRLTDNSTENWRKCNGFQCCKTSAQHCKESAPIYAYYITPETPTYYMMSSVIADCPNPVPPPRYFGKSTPVVIVIVNEIVLFSLIRPNIFLPGTVVVNEKYLPSLHWVSSSHANCLCSRIHQKSVALVTAAYCFYRGKFTCYERMSFDWIPHQWRQSGLKSGGRGSGFENWGSWVLKVQQMEACDIARAGPRQFGALGSNV